MKNNTKGYWGSKAETWFVDDNIGRRYTLRSDPLSFSSYILTLNEGDRRVEIQLGDHEIEMLCELLKLKVGDETKYLLCKKCTEQFRGTEDRNICDNCVKNAVKDVENFNALRNKK